MVEKHNNKVGIFTLASYSYVAICLTVYPIMNGTQWHHNLQYETIVIANHDNS